MIAEITEIEQPGKNAVDHPCEMKIEIPGDDGEPSSFKKCRILALVQCSECAVTPNRGLVIGWPAGPP